MHVIFTQPMKRKHLSNLKINKTEWPVIEEECYLMIRIYANYKRTIWLASICRCVIHINWCKCVFLCVGCGIGLARVSKSSGKEEKYLLSRRHHLGAEIRGRERESCRKRRRDNMCLCQLYCFFVSYQGAVCKLVGVIPHISKNTQTIK